MARLVVGGAAPVFGADHHLALGAEDDPLERVGEVGLGDKFVIPPRREQGCFVDEICEVGADHSRCPGGQPAEIDVRPERHATRVHAEDRLAARPVRRLHGDPAVEAARPQ